MMSDEKNYNGEMAISEGNILDKAKFDTMKADASKSFCIIASGDKEAVADKAVMKVSGFSDVKKDDASKRMAFDMTMTIAAEDGAPRMFGIKCYTVEGKDAYEEASAAFKGLLTLKLDSPAAEPPAADDQSKQNDQAQPEEPKKDDAKPADPAPAPAPAEPAPAPVTVDPAPPAPPAPTPADAAAAQHAAASNQALKAIEDRLNQM
jgi:hypothetical protein